MTQVDFYRSNGIGLMDRKMVVVVVVVISNTAQIYRAQNAYI